MRAREWARKMPHKPAGSTKAKRRGVKNRLEIFFLPLWAANADKKRKHLISFAQVYFSTYCAYVVALISVCCVVVFKWFLFSFAEFLFHFLSFVTDPSVVGWCAIVLGRLLWWLAGAENFREGRTCTRDIPPKPGPSEKLSRRKK